MIGPRELIENLRTDCIHYLGDRPCWPHVESGHRCTCIHFQLTKRRGVIIKLGAAGDVLRSTPLLRALEPRSEEHTSELQSLTNLVCRLLLEKKNKKKIT